MIEFVRVRLFLIHFTLDPDRIFIMNFPHDFLLFFTLVKSKNILIQRLIIFSVYE
jgi:hypothetical protein